MFKRNDRPGILLCILLISSGISAGSLAEFNDDFLIQNWNNQDDLPQNRVTTIMQSSNGYLWVGTPSGLLRYDGLNFIHFNRRNTDILLNETITCLHEDLSGKIWIGTDGGGLYSLQGGDWKRYTRQRGLSNNHIRAVVSEWNGNIWIATDYGLNLMKDDAIEIYTVDDGLPENIITALETDLTGKLWIGTLRNGIARYSKGAFQLFGTKEGLHCLNITDIHTDDDGRLWIGTINGLYTKAINEQIIDFISGTEYLPATSIKSGPDRITWVASITGEIRQFQGLTFNSDWQSPPFENEVISDLCLDHNNNLWFATELSGLFQIKPGYVQTIRQDQGLPEDVISTVFTDAEGNVWIGTRSNGLYKMVDGIVKSISDRSNELNSQVITALFQDQSGRIWIGTNELGLFTSTGNSAVPFSGNSGLSSQYISAVTQDENNIIWIGTDNGLNRLKDSNAYQIMQLNNHNITCILASSNGLYIGTDQGAYFNGGDTLQPIELTSTYHITALFEDNDHSFWLGTDGNGLLCLSGDTLESISARDHFFSDYIFSITNDDSGNFWFCSYDGIFRYSRQALKDLFENPDSRSVPVYFNENEGMISRQCSNIGQPAVTVSDDGRFIYATHNGLVVIDPKQQLSNQLNPIIIEAIEYDNQMIAAGDMTSITVPSRALRVHFTAIDLTAPEKCHFWYRLEGYNDQFTYIPSGDQRTAQYSDLHPGKYTFIIQAINNSDVQEILEKRLTIVIPKPFLARSLIIGAIILISVTAVFVVKYRYQRTLPKPDKYATSTLSADKYEEIVPQLLQLMETAKRYLEPNLTLKELSKDLHIHPNHLSQIINAKFGMNFNDYINGYRISEAKKQLADPDNRDQTILNIMYDCGFNSKSVFNTAFKKFTGSTPSEYRRKQS